MNTDVDWCFLMVFRQKNICIKVNTNVDWVFMVFIQQIISCNVNTDVDWVVLNNNILVLR